MRFLKAFIRIVSVIAFACSILLLVLYVNRSDALTVSSYEYVTAKLSSSFSYKIAQVSDYHNHGLSYEGTDLLASLAEAAPDAIVFTGDLIDDHTKESDMRDLGELFAYAGTKPSFFVTGNHEETCPLALKEELEGLLADNGITDLSARRQDLGNGLVLTGVKDPGLDEEPGLHFGEYYGDVPAELDALGPVAEDKVNLVLAHRPAMADLTKERGYDIQLSGHLHGGQAKVGSWVIGAAPWEPYIEGAYDLGGETLYVSRGLGYSYNLPFRHACDAELLTLTIKGAA